jgi:hypothetical protein
MTVFYAFGGFRRQVAFSSLVFPILRATALDMSVSVVQYVSPQNYTINV